MKDRLSPSVFGVGIIGTAENLATRKGSRRIYYTWRNMIRRCYDKNYTAYKWYGAKGITVCERWKRLDYFAEDVVKLPGYEYDRFENGELELDKDFYAKGIKQYNPDVCILISHSENNKEALYRRWHKDKSVSTIP